MSIATLVLALLAIMAASSVVADAVFPTLYVQDVERAIVLMVERGMGVGITTWALG